MFQVYQPIADWNLESVHPTIIKAARRGRRLLYLSSAVKSMSRDWLYQDTNRTRWVPSSTQVIRHQPYSKEPRRAWTLPELPASRANFCSVGSTEPSRRARKHCDPRHRLIFSVSRAPSRADYSSCRHRTTISKHHNRRWPIPHTKLIIYGRPHSSASKK